VYTVSIRHKDSPILREIRWCLDFPKNEDVLTLASLRDEGVRFQGWVVHKKGVRPEEVFLRSESQRLVLEFAVPRPDVVSKVLQETPKNNKQLKCGFKVDVRPQSGKLEFGVRVDGVDYVLAEVSFSGELKVIEGREGWLFLDNDTNRSVDQFRGLYLLDLKELNAWRSYLDELASAATRFGVRHAVLVAPAKEMVISHAYPHEKGTVTPIEQLLSIAAPHHNLVYPVDVLRDSEVRTFRVCDTHWSLHGAMLATLEVVKQLGIAEGEVKDIFDKDIYVEKEQYGDLGSKLFPPRSAKERVLRSFTHRRIKRYDNALPNFGRVQLLAYSEAPVKACCVVFGSSSSYSMLDYVGRIFERVVFVHSAGNVDLEVVRRERPDFLVCQTNGRFVVRAPVVGYDLSQVMAEKIAALPPEKRAEIAKQSEGWVIAQGEWGRYYHELLLCANRRAGG